MNFETSGTYSERERAALSYAEAITWRLDPDDAFWARLHDHFTEEELVELACFISLTMGQQSWIRLLNIDHHQVMAGTSVAMAPGFETAADRGGDDGRDTGRRRGLGPLWSVRDATRVVRCAHATRSEKFRNSRVFHSQGGEPDAISSETNGDHPITRFPVTPTYSIPVYQGEVRCRRPG